MPGATSERRFFDVAIAGGGFAGQTLAMVLAKQAPRGFRITLVDTEAPAAQSGRAQDARGLALSSATRSLLAVLGLWDALRLPRNPSRRSRSPTVLSRPISDRIFSASTMS